ncbi:MAG: WYL domain-containing protein [Lachnospiraceae bacterium]|nr:WYL domain-containing protein [Lachnospiraceae bacterium]
MRGKELIDIYIMEILVRCSSEERKLTQKEIIQHLFTDYEMEVSRNTLSQYLAEMKRNGYIEGTRGVCCRRIFSYSELAILANSIAAVKTVPSIDIQRLIEKLKSMAEPERRKEFCHSYFLADVNHTDNKNVGKIMGIISQAIECKKKIEITGCLYDVNGFLQEGKTYIVNPYYIVAEKSRYYLICMGNRGDVEPRRIDRISKVKILEEKRVEICEIEKYKNYTFQIEEYMKEHIYMYSGECARVTLKIEKKNIGDFIDWFGKDYRKIDEQEGKIIIQVKANIEAVYFWALQYSRIAEVLSPKSLRDKIREGAISISKMYE